MARNFKQFQLPEPRADAAAARQLARHQRIGIVPMPQQDQQQDWGISNLGGGLHPAWAPWIYAMNQQPNPFTGLAAGQAMQGIGQQLGGAAYAANALGSQNRQAQYEMMGQLYPALFGSATDLEAARLNAKVGLNTNRMNYKSGINTNRTSLEIERLRQQGALDRIGAIGPLFSAFAGNLNLGGGGGAFTGFTSNFGQGITAYTDPETGGLPGTQMPGQTPGFQFRGFRAQRPPKLQPRTQQPADQWRYKSATPSRVREWAKSSRVDPSVVRGLVQGGFFNA